MSVSEVELGEVFRLGEAAGMGRIVADVGDRLAGSWLTVSRFRQTQELMVRSLRIQTSPLTLLWAGRAFAATGDQSTALEYFTQALPLQQEVGDRAGEAVTRYNIAIVHRADGNLAAAVAELEQVVALDRAVQHPDLDADTAVLHQVRDELQTRPSSDDIDD